MILILINIPVTLKHFYQISNKKGSSLLEVVISSMLLMFGIMGVIGLIAFSKNIIKLGIDKEFIALEANNIFEKFSFHEELKTTNNFDLSLCDEIKNKSNEVVLNRKNICNRIKANLGHQKINDLKEIKLEETDSMAKLVKINFNNSNDKFLYGYSKIFALK